MIIKLIDQLTEDFVARYKQDIRAAESVLFRAMEDVDFATSRGASKLARNIRGEYQALNDKKLAELLSNHKEVLIDHAANGDVLRPNMQRAIDRLVLETVQTITAQKERDHRELEKAYRNITIQARLIMNAYGWKPTAAILAAKKQNKGLTSYFALDRSGKRWDSFRYVRTAFRHTLLTIYNEAKIFSMNERGIGLFTAAHEDDESHPNHGMIFGILKSEEFPTYDEIKQDVFHPNSRLIVAG